MSVQFGSVSPLLDARLEGGLITAATGINTYYYNFQVEQGIDKIIFNGIATYAWDSNVGDNITLWTEYYVPQLDEWKRYKKFGKTFQVFPKVEQKNILFPTTPSNGVRIAFQYDNKGTEPVKLSYNLYNFIDRQNVKPSEGQEGHDW